MMPFDHQKINLRINSSLPVAKARPRNVFPKCRTMELSSHESLAATLHRQFVRRTQSLLPHGRCTHSFARNKQILIYIPDSDFQIYILTFHTVLTHRVTSKHVQKVRIAKRCVEASNGISKLLELEGHPTCPFCTSSCPFCPFCPFSVSFRGCSHQLRTHQDLSCHSTSSHSCMGRGWGNHRR